MIARVKQHAARRPIAVAPISVPAGWPSPAQDYYSADFDLNEFLVTDQESTFLVRVSGDSMIGAGIFDGDELVVDRSLIAKSGDVVVAAVDGEFTVKRLEQTECSVLLKSENPDYPPIAIPELSELRVWGVVTYCLHHVRQGSRHD